MNQQKPKTRFYAEGLRFECVGCGDCCKFANGYVLISPLEIDIVAKYINLTYKEFIAKYVHNYQGRTVLKDKNDACIFFKDKQCSIYNVRPMQCRTFPFWPANLKSQYRWKLVSETCEGIGEGRLFSYEKINTIKNDLGETPAGPTVKKTLFIDD